LCTNSLASEYNEDDVNLVRVVKSVNGFKEEWEKMRGIDVMKKYMMVCDPQFLKKQKWSYDSEISKN